MGVLVKWSLRGNRRLREVFAHGDATVFLMKITRPKGYSLNNVSLEIFFIAIFRHVRVSVELTYKFGAVNCHYHTTGLTIRMHFGTHRKRIVNPTKNTKMMKDK